MARCYWLCGRDASEPSGLCGPCERERVARDERILAALERRADLRREKPVDAGTETK